MSKRLIAIAFAWTTMLVVAAQPALAGTQYMG